MRLPWIVVSLSFTSGMGEKKTKRQPEGTASNCLVRTGRLIASQF